MLKPRYVIIIIIVLFVIMTVIGFGIEQTFVRRAGQTATLYVQIASDCALKSAIMSDEFFTVGHDSSGSRDGAMRLGGVTVNKTNGTDGMLIWNGSKFVAQNVFHYAKPNISTSGTADDVIKRTYETMFTSSDFKKWAGTILGCNLKNWKVGQKTGRKIYWMDELVVADASGGHLEFSQGSTYIPRLLTIGGSLFTDPAYNVSAYTNGSGNMMTALYKAMQLAKSADSTGPFYGSSTKSANKGLSDRDKVREILSAADYWNYERHSSIMASDSDWFGGSAAAGGTYKTVTYFYTPVSVGLTYLDKTVLDVLFRANMDLLMRAKYIQSDGTLSGYDSWLYDEPGEAYSSEKPYGATWDKCTVNNGSFYYVRGEATSAGGERVYKDMRSNYMSKPDIEYMYISLSKEDLASMSAATVKAWNKVLQRAVSPVTTLQSLLNKNTNSDTERYELCIAKVTFYADFIVPYTSSAMRGMSMWYGNKGSVSDKLTESSVRGLEISEEMINSVSSLYLNGNKTDTLSTVKDSTMSSHTQYAYTTYFAVVD